MKIVKILFNLILVGITIVALGCLLLFITTGGLNVDEFKDKLNSDLGRTKDNFKDNGIKGKMEEDKRIEIKDNKFDDNILKYSKDLDAVNINKYKDIDFKSILADDSKFKEFDKELKKDKSDVNRIKSSLFSDGRKYLYTDIQLSKVEVLKEKVNLYTEGLAQVNKAVLYKNERLYEKAIEKLGLKD